MKSFDKGASVEDKSSQHQDILEQIEDAVESDANNETQKRKKIVYITLGILFIFTLFLLFFSGMEDENKRSRERESTLSFENEAKGNRVEEKIIFDFERQLSGEKTNNSTTQTKENIVSIEKNQKQDTFKRDKSDLREPQKRIVVEKDKDEITHNTTNRQSAVIVDSSEVVKAYEEAISTQDAINVIDEKIQTLGQKIQKTVELFRQNPELLILEKNDRRDILKKILEKDKKQLHKLYRYRSLLKGILIKRQNSTGNEIDVEIEEILNTIENNVPKNGNPDSDISFTLQ